MDKLPAIRFRRVTRDNDYLDRRYLVLRDGVEIGAVGVSDGRWSVLHPQPAVPGLRYPTRAEAVARVLGSAGVSVYDAKTLALTGRNETKAERAAAEPPAKEG